MELNKKLGPLTTGNSDGAGHFHKGLGQLLSKDLKWAIERLSESDVLNDDDLDIDLILSNEPGVTMQQPYCVNKRVDVLAGDQAMYDLVDLEVENGGND